MMRIHIKKLTPEQPRTLAWLVCTEDLQILVEETSPLRWVVSMPDTALSGVFDRGWQITERDTPEEALASLVRIIRGRRLSHFSGDNRYDVNVPVSLHLGDDWHSISSFS